jgi:hypothetical protein
VDLG